MASRPRLQILTPVTATNYLLWFPVGSYDRLILGCRQVKQHSRGGRRAGAAAGGGGQVHGDLQNLGREL